jgi:hypothetical protein
MELIDFRRSHRRETPWHEMALLADDARMKGDERSAIRLIQFAYWAADELVRALPTGVTPKKKAIDTLRKRLI